MQTEFGLFLKKLRDDRGLTLRNVQDQVKISNAYLSQVERGARGIPTMKVLIKLAQAYGVSVSTLNQKAAAELKIDEDLILADVDRNDILSSSTSFKKLPPPEAMFILRAYENLTDEGKQKVKDFVQFITEQEKRK